MTNVANHQDLARTEPLPSDTAEKPISGTGEKLKIKAEVEGETYVVPLVARVLLVLVIATVAHFILAMTGSASLISGLVVVLVCDHPKYATETLRHISDLARKRKKK